MEAVTAESLSIEVCQDLSSFLTFDFEPSGKWFEQYTYLRHLGDTEEIPDESSSESENEAVVEDTPEYLAYLHSLDPKEWKEQDHYRVLGLEKLRINATAHQIKKAYKRAVLNHHPDKSKNKETGSKDNNEYFNCITRAFEQLSVADKRRAYDSVDPEFDDSVPAVNDKNKKSFFKVFGDAFERNSRWSNKKDVPAFGDIDSTFEDINKFYGFWYEFDSWREYSYKDEEDKGTATDRYERRYMDKENKAARLKLKKEEVIRVRKLVDNAYACDPRIQKLKNEEKAKKEAVKQKKLDEIRLKQEAEQKLIDDARAAKAREEEEARLKAESDKKNKEKNKKLLTKERKNLRTTVKEFEYFSSNSDEQIANMEKIESLVDILNLQELKALNDSISASENKKETARTLIFDNYDPEFTSLRDKLSKYVPVVIEKPPIEQLKERKLMTEAESEAASAKFIQEQSASQIQPAQEQENIVPVTDNTKKDTWNDEEIALLVKAVKLKPVGVANRWKAISEFIEEHSKGKYKRSDKEVLQKTKELAKLDPSAKEAANKNAFEKTLQGIKHNERTDVESQESVRFISAGEQLLGEQGSNPGVWTLEEQKILEQALKTFPASIENRWEKIAECLPTRSKKDCMVRYKELVAAIQAKKKTTTKSK